MSSEGNLISQIHCNAPTMSMSSPIGPNTNQWPEWKCPWLWRLTLFWALTWNCFQLSHFSEGNLISQIYCIAIEMPSQCQYHHQFSEGNLISKIYCITIEMLKQYQCQCQFLGGQPNFTGSLWCSHNVNVITNNFLEGNLISQIHWDAPTMLMSSPMQSANQRCQ